MKLKDLSFLNCESPKYIAKLFSLSICFGCDATGKQMILVREIVDDLTFDAGDVITLTQLPNKENTESKVCDKNI